MRVNAAATVEVLDQMATKRQKEREDQLEAVERDALAQPDAWKAYLQVSDAVPADALKLLGRNDVIEFRVLRSSLVSACRTAK